MKEIKSTERDVSCTIMAELARRESEFITRNSTHMNYMTHSYTRNKRPRRKTVNLGFAFDKAKE